MERPEGSRRGIRFNDTLVAMAEAPQPTSEGSNVDGWFIFFVIIVLLVLWLRGGGWHGISQQKINFGWQSASTTGAFPFAPNFENLAPTVSIPTGPEGPRGPN